MFDQIKTMIAGVLGSDGKNITPESKLKSGLGISSVEFVDLAMTIEEEFGVTLDEDMLKKLETVDDLCKYVESLRA